MKLGLKVLSQGKSEGKIIPITLSQFIIGRDPECQLRPASGLISKRHCAILIRGEKAFVRDFDSTNGTFVNEEPVKGERELNAEDVLKVGPLQFSIAMEVAAPTPAAKPAAKAAAPRPVPAAVESEPEPAKSAPSRTAAEEAADDEADSIAAMLLSVEGDDSSPTSESDIPQGSTVMEILTPPLPPVEEPSEGGVKKPEQKKAVDEKANTSNAAKAILEKYMKRPRG